MTAQRMEPLGQAEQPQSGATAEHAAQIRSGTPDAGFFPAANSVQSGAPRGESPPVTETAFLCRAMRPEDVPACAAIEAAVSDGWSAHALAGELAQPAARLFVAEIPGGTAPGAQADETGLTPFHMNANGGADLAGSAHAQPLNGQPSGIQPPHPQPIAALAVFQLVCEEASLYTVSTAPALRRQGAARALLQYAFAQLAAQGAQTVFLEVRAQNTAARALYTALGFEKTGIRRGFYTKPADDAVLMQKSLRNS